MATKKSTATRTKKPQPLLTASHNIQEAVAEHFGFKGFKGKQEDAINSLLAGNDTFVIMPTGG